MDIRRRQEAIIRCLRRGGLTPVATLVIALGASRRTILRDVAALRDQGYLIHSESGRGGGLLLDPQSVQTTPRLSVAEVFALLISVATMRAAGSLPFSGLADRGLAKIEKALPPEKLLDLRRFLDCLHIGKLSPQQDLSDLGRIDPDLLPAFESAFLAHLQLGFDYRDAQGRQTRRTVEPQAMLILPPLWYLVGWDPSKQAFRHFRMDRIRAATPVEGLPFRKRHVPFDADICPYKEMLA